MKKLRLDPEALSVETFRTEPASASEQGTVRAFQESTVYGATECGLCVYPTTDCNPSADKTWCVCVSQWNCITD